MRQITNKGKTEMRPGAIILDEWRHDSMIQPCPVCGVNDAQDCGQCVKYDSPFGPEWDCKLGLSDCDGCKHLACHACKQ